VKFLLGLVAALPLRAGYALAWLSCLILYRVVRYRRKTVRENLEHAFPGKTRDEIAAIEKAAYRHLANLVFEIIRSTRMRRDEFRQRVRFDNEDLLARVTGNYSRQAIILLIHQGNWEWTLHSAMATLPVPADPVYKPLHSPFWERYMLDARSRLGARPMAINSVAREVVRGRRRKRLIVMLADQAGPRRSGYWTNFLNRPASFYRGADKLARSLQLPVLFARCRRESTGHYSIRLHEISLPPHDSNPQSILEAYVRMAERFIAEQPETYLWTNRRWKKAPPEDFVRS
jgi:KDO2-lipid IV(A) lauroyltransferase